MQSGSRLVLTEAEAAYQGASWLPRRAKGGSSSGCCSAAPRPRRILCSEEFPHRCSPRRPRAGARGHFSYKDARVRVEGDAAVALRLCVGSPVVDRAHVSRRLGDGACGPAAAPTMWQMRCVCEQCCTLHN